MDKLKNFIDTNREAFEDDLLPEGHFERFEQKLAAPRKSRATLYSLCAFAAAACIALLFLFKMPGGTPLPQQKPVASQPHKCQMKEEIEELRLYYNMQMNEIISQMQAAEGVSEELKICDQLAWVGAMNSIRIRAEEIIRSEMIYV